mmetsp:Transcript_21263/g.39855  ORF Transcript_21263/g.39855 Transcript_21263/m.39855 type:complete len:134 (-) Transcript_21263:168-569(-)
MRESRAHLLVAEEYLKVPSLMERFFGFKRDDPRNRERAETDPRTLDIMAKMIYGRKQTVKGTGKYVKSDMQLKIQDVPMLIDLIAKAVAEEQRKGRSLHAQNPQGKFSQQKAQSNITHQKSKANPPHVPPGPL